MIRSALARRGWPGLESRGRPVGAEGHGAGGRVSQGSLLHAVPCGGLPLGPSAARTRPGARRPRPLSPRRERRPWPFRRFFPSTGHLLLKGAGELKGPHLHENRGAEWWGGALCKPVE